MQVWFGSKPLSDCNLSSYRATLGYKGNKSDQERVTCMEEMQGDVHELQFLVYIENAKSQNIQEILEVE